LEHKTEHNMTHLMVVQQFLKPGVHVCLLDGVDELLLRAAVTPAAGELELIAVRQLHQVLGEIRPGAAWGEAEDAHIVHW
jgi:hypothetical protein